MAPQGVNSSTLAVETYSMRPARAGTPPQEHDETNTPSVSVPEGAFCFYAIVPDMPEPYSVSQFNTVVSDVLKSSIGLVQIKGEVSEYKLAQGKFVYFNLKDSLSVVNCFAMAFRLDFPLADGQEVVVTGTPSIHIKSGRYSVTVESLTLHGEGALQKAYEELKAKLEAEGLFDAIHKRPLPRFPRTIGIVTSDTGAAINDIQKVINGRWGGLHLLLAPAKVQGSEAVDELVAAIHYFNQHHPVDVIIFGRGGGSLEDLQAFNAERVARAIFASKIPIISAVGHEHNITISDLVADVRAATPSNAAELAVPDRDHVQATIAAHRDACFRHVEVKIGSSRSLVISHFQHLRLLVNRQFEAIRQVISTIRHYAKIIPQTIGQSRQTISASRHHLLTGVGTLLRDKKQVSHELVRMLTVLNPQSILSRGYSITYAASGNTVLTSVAQIPPDGRIRTRLNQGEFTSITKPIKRPKAPEPHDQSTLFTL